jgi:predicted DNA-binding protein with PD1-like motif
MQSKEENQFIAIKLDDGEDLLGSLGMIIEKHRIRSALILSGIGMLKDLEIGYYNGENYINERFIDPMELLSMHGSIAEGSENKIHIHVSLASSEHKVFGGHLIRATVCMLNEIVLYKMEDTVLSRKLNEKTGLMELSIS